MGQRFIQLLLEHPFFKVAQLGASERSSGQPYRKAIQKWILPTPLPRALADVLVVTCRPENFADCDMIFSALDSSVARDIGKCQRVCGNSLTDSGAESAFISAGFAVFSNASAFRMATQVPLVVPLANPDHIKPELVSQQKAANSGGFIITNANCSTTGLVVVLQALNQAGFQIDSVHVTTLQAISGAGYPGLSALDVVDNVVPFIGGEEEKLETEPLKILGHWLHEPSDQHKGQRLVQSGFRISASCHRVPVLDGHLLSVSVKFQNGAKPKTVEELEQALEDYSARLGSGFAKVPSMPKRPIQVFRCSDGFQDRPQPRLDRDREGGLCVCVGRVRECPLLDYKLSILSHNTILGAAGSSILNAEIALMNGTLA